MYVVVASWSFRCMFFAYFDILKYMINSLMSSGSCGYSSHIHCSQQIDAVKETTWNVMIKKELFHQSSPDRIADS